MNTYYINFKLYNTFNKYYFLYNNILILFK